MARDLLDAICSTRSAAGATRTTLITRMTDSLMSLTYTVPAVSMAMPKGVVNVE